MIWKTVPVRPLLFLIVFLLCASSAIAQSGRRTNKPTASATPAPEPTPAVKSKPVEKTDLAIILGLERDVFSGISYYDNVVLQSCADRLKHASVTVDVSDRDLNRGDAVKRAKASKDAFVVLLKIRSDTSIENPTPDPNDLSIEYVVFAPTTAKVVTSGHSYPGNVRKGGVSVPVNPGRSNSAIYLQQLLKQAAQDAAERILNALHVFDLPSTHP